jgi:hypothetical protein
MLSVNGSPTECVKAIEVLLAEVHTGGGEVVAEMLFGARRDQRDDRAGLLPHPRNRHLRG